MKLIVFTYPLTVCGTTVNAIELSSALRDYHGYEVALFAAPGPLMSLATEKGLRIIRAPEASAQPSRARIQALREVVRAETPDLVHAWDWPQSIDAYYGIYISMRVPLIVTSMSMHVDRLLPKVVPTTFGTPELVERSRAIGYEKVSALLPPVDIDMNAPGTADGHAFRRTWGVQSDEIAVVTVSRLDEHMKSESLFSTVEAIRILGRELPLRFLVVGDGNMRCKLEQRASEVNSDLGRQAITLTGQMVDPRPAYAAADIAVCMGGSALRAMAFAKPVVIVGEGGFAKTLSQKTANLFLYRGIYGRESNYGAADLLASEIHTLSQQPELREELGCFSRGFVVRHFGLRAVANTLHQYCQDAVSDVHTLPAATVDAVRMAAVYMRERRFLTALRAATRS